MVLTETPDFFSKSWCNLTWTDWIPLHAPLSVFKLIPTSSGVYRVRPEGWHQLAYIGQTKRGLRERLRTLAIHSHRNEIPFNDPHTAAPSLWILRVEEGMTFECSAAPTNVASQKRRALEDMLLWKHRLERGESTLCNHGRFHPRYFRSGNRKTGKRGGKLPRGQTNPAGGPSAPPLRPHGKPQDSDWMGLVWSSLEVLRGIDLSSIPKGIGLYKIVDAIRGRLLYVGESKQLRKRIKDHSWKTWGDDEPLVSYHILHNDVLDHQRREMETDLIGGYYEAFGTAPKFQYGNQ